MNVRVGVVEGKGFLQPTLCVAFGIESQIQGKIKRKTENTQLQAAS